MAKKSSTTLKFLVSLEAPPGFTTEMVRHFIYKALEQARGLRSDTDPMRKFDLDSIHITLHERHTTYS